MLTFLAILFSILGLIIGSFLNVVIYRYNSGFSINGRSKCLSCSKQLKWYELVPIFSFLAQFGKCRKCGSKISWQYPLVEIFTGLLFLFVFLSIEDVLIFVPVLGAILLVLEFIIVSILVVIFVYDLKHKIIPNGLVYSFSFVSLIHLFVMTPSNMYDSYIFIWNLLAGPILFTPFYLLWRISDGKWIGLGDGKLALGIGWFLGLIFGASAIILSFWIGAIFSIFILLVSRLKQSSKNITIKSEIPFAPFMITGALIAFFFGVDVLSLGIFFGL